MANFRHYAAVSAALFVVFIANLQLAHSQTYTPPPHFSHIVIVIQENRTPDDLFGGAPVGAKFHLRRIQWLYSVHRLGERWPE